MSVSRERRVAKPAVAPAAPSISPLLRPANLPGDDFEDEKPMRGIGFDSLDLSASAAYATDVEQCRFSGVKMPSTIRQATLINTEFSVCDLANVQADESSLLQSRVSTSRMTGMSWIRGVLRDVVVESSRANLASFRYSRLKTVVFKDCELQQADFQRAEFRSVLFESCDLSGAHFTGADLQHNVRFEDCVLANITGVASLKGATIQGGDLFGLAASLAREAGIAVEW